MIEYWLPLLLVFVAYQINAEELIIDSKYKCGREYNIEHTESVDIKLQGGWSGTQSCEILFENTVSSGYTLCVHPKYFFIDCSTVIEYQEHFVASNINDGILTCDENNDQSYEQHCISYMSKFYVVFKKTGDDDTFESFENAHIRVERVAEDTFDLGSSGFAWIGIIAVIPGIACIICVICYKIRQTRRQEQFRNAQVNYNTHVGATVQTGVPQAYPNTNPQQPLIQQYGYPAQQPMAQGIQSTDGYTIHPTVTAYPANQPAPVSYPPVPPQQQHYVAPSAPYVDMNAPPPSYESVIQK